MKSQTIKIAAFLILAAVLPTFGQAALNTQAHRDRYAQAFKEAAIKSGNNINVWAVGTNLHIYDARVNNVLAYQYHTHMLVRDWAGLKKLGFTSVVLVDGIEYGYEYTWDLAKPKAGSFWRSSEEQAEAEDKAEADK